MNRSLLLFVFVTVALGSPVQGAEKIAGRAAQFRIASPETAHFIRVPFLPSCMRVSMVQGDPRKGASIVLARIAPGCVIPAHWHNANTQLIFISGYGTHQIRDGKPARVGAGDYISLPAGRVHSFKCLSSCLVYNLQDRVDVVHWIDAQGHEISPARAFAH